MRLKQIEIKKLFGLYDHTTPLNLNERVTVLYGVNGVGKTTGLKIIEAILNPESRGWNFSTLLDKLNRRTWTANVDNLVNQLREKNRTYGLSNSQIKEGIQAILASVPATQYPNLCQGHDTAEVVALGFHTVLGNNDKLDAQRVEQFLRTTFNRDDFSTTALYQRLCEWEQNHAPFRVLKA